MKSTFPTRALALFAAVATAVTTLLSHAATPAAVWDGDFNDLTKFTGYTLTDWNQTHGDGNSSVTIDRANQGLMFDCSAASGYFTVLVKYSNLSASASNKRVLFATTANSNYNYNRCGVRLLTSGKVLGLWNLANSESGDNDYGSESSGTVPTAGTLAFVYDKGSSGVSVYAAGVGDDLPTTALWNASGLKAGDIYGFAIGGSCRGSNVSGAEAAQGMTITGLAVFNSVLGVNEMNSYIWPSQIQQITVNSAASVSDINAQFDSTNYKVATVSVANGVTITVNAAFSEKILSVTSAGTITLYAESQPDASYLSSVDFSGVQGGLIRSWLTPGVVGFNFRSASGSDVSGALVAGENWIHDNNSANGNSTAMFADGLSTLTWTSANTWACAGSTIISGYLDDGANGGNGATVKLSNVPYATYDVVVYCSSDSNPGAFLAKTVNGKTYTWDSGTGMVVEGNATWGKAAISIPVYGVNALRINNLSGPLTIYGTARDGNNRGGIAAFQIMPPGTPDNIRTYTLTLNGTATTWSSGSWTLEGNTVAAPTSGFVEIVATASTELTVDTDVSLADLKVSGSENVVVNVATNDNGSLTAIKTTIKGGVFQQGSPAVLGATSMIAVENGATFDMNGLDINAATKVYLAGAGAGNWPWALTSSSGVGSAILGGLYLTANATIGGAYELKVGQYSLNTAYYCYLQGYTLTKIGGGSLTCNNMNTPGTGTIEVYDCAMSVNSFNNLNNNGGNTTVILHDGASLANGTDRTVPMGTLKLLGGTLTTARAFKVNTLFVGAGETANLAFGAGASASLTGDLTVTTALTLDGAMSFNKDEDASEDVVVTASGTLSSSGAISVGAGVTLNLGVNRPTGELTIANGGTLVVRLQTSSDVVELSASAQPANVVLYDANGNKVENPRIAYSNGTLTISPPVPTLLASGTTEFDTASNWVDSTMPNAHGDAIIELSGDADIRLSGNYLLGKVTISGNGEVAFTSTSGSTFETANIYLKNGATLRKTASPAVTATEINLDSGTVLKLSGVITESAVISGSGAVETSGDVVFAGINTFTGGLTVNSGSIASTTTATGFGKNNYGQAIANLSRIVVIDGGSLDLANTKDTCYSITIAGKGVMRDGVYKGAVFNSGAEMGQGSRQTASLTLSADAMVKAEASTNGWGLVNSGHAATVLALGGHTLTVSGAGYFPIVNANTANGTTTTGTLIADGVTLGLVETASNLTGVDVILKGCARVNLAIAPTALGSLTIKPSATGTTASKWNLPEAFTAKIETTNVGLAGLADGTVLPLFTAPSETTLSSETISVLANTRFTTTISGNTVTATFHAGMPAAFMHYDFNDVQAAASDSTTAFNVGGENTDASFVRSKVGKAIKVHTNFTPWWNTVANGISPFHDDSVSVTAVAKLRQTNIILWGLGAAGENRAVGLVATDAHTVAVVAKRDSSEVETLATLTTTRDLTTGWHFIAVVADESGTTLYVDDQSVSSANGIPTGIGQQGQLGSFHGGAFGAAKAGEDGYRLDDWRVYDTALTAGEITAIRTALLPYATFFLLR